MPDRSAPDNWKALARHVQDRRRVLGIPSQKAAADLAGIHLNTWSRLETGNSISRNSLVRVAHALEWPPGRPWLILCGEDPGDDDPEPVPPGDMAEYAAAVRRRRRDQGLSQQELADLAGVSRGTIRNVEAGHAPPYPRTVDMIEDALTRPREASEPLGGDAQLPGLKATARAVARRIATLEAEAVAHDRNGNKQQALYAAHTAAYLRSFLAEFIGPLWLTWAQEDA